MQKEIKINTGSNAKILHELVSARLHEKKVETEAFEKGVSVYLEKEMENDIKPIIAEAAGEYIVNNLENEVVSGILKKDYGFFTKAEYAEIMQTVKDNISAPAIDGNGFLQKRKLYITKRVMEYLEEKDTIILDGFISFRLRDYLDAIEDVVDRSTDDFIMHREYNEFLDLLKHYVSIQESKIYSLHVIAMNNGTYLVTDENGNLVKDKETMSFIAEMDDNNLEADDVLVSTLISLAPKETVIHSANNGKKETMTTIEKVFSAKRCSGCSLCLLANNEQGTLQ